MLNRPRRILFLCITKPSFVNADLAILKKHYDVRTICFGSIKNNRLKVPGLLLRLIAGTRRCDLTFSWFADSHAYAGVRISRLFHKKSVVVIGGYEVAKMPDIQYGITFIPKMEKRIRYILRNADKILMVSDSLRVEAIANFGITDRDFAVIPTGHDHEKFKPAGEKTNRVLTVGYLGCGGEGELKRKGLDLFIEAARLMPNVEFTAIGITSREALIDLLGPLPSNIKTLGLVPNDLLVQFYQEAKVYCQLSMHEGLPSALCEGMLCECVPVGTNVRAITSVIGDTGFVVVNRNPQEVADAISKALSSHLGEKARQRIIDNYSKEARERNITGIINELLPLEK